MNFNLPVVGRDNLPEVDSTKPVKVCLASMAPFVGGAEVAAERLALGLQDAGHEVVIVLGKRAEVFERMERAELRCRHAPMEFTDKWHMIRYWRARQGLRKLLRDECPDIIHSNDLPTHQIVSDAARGLGIPRICHHRFPFDRRCIDWLNKFGAERHLFVSQSLMEEQVACSERLKRSPCSVVYDGLPMPAVPDDVDRATARRQLGLAADQVIALFAGQIIERKGVADLLQAWLLLKPAWGEKAELVMVGDDVQGQGTYRRAMEQLAENLKCGARFVGFQRNVGTWHTAADVVLVPSHVEPLGNATLEAMSFARPVIGCAVGGIPEMIVPEETGLLVPPRSPESLARALERLLLDSDLRASLGKQGRSRCEERFSLQAHTESVLSEYRQVLRPKRLMQPEEVRA